MVVAVTACAACGADTEDEQPRAHHEQRGCRQAQTPVHGVGRVRVHPQLGVDIARDHAWRCRTMMITTTAAGRASRDDDEQDRPAAGDSRQMAQKKPGWTEHLNFVGDLMSALSMRHRLSWGNFLETRFVSSFKGPGILTGKWKETAE